VAGFRNAWRPPAPGRRRWALLACALLCALPAAWLTGCTPRASSLPLVILEVSPQSGGSLAEGSPLLIRFNLPLDEGSLARRLSVQPPRDLELICDGPLAEVRLRGAVPGRVYTVSVAAGVRGAGGEVLADSLVTQFVMAPAAPAGAAGQGQDTGGKPPAEGPPEVLGARLYLDGRGVFACDLRGNYQVPHFDSLRLYLSGPPRPAEVAGLALQEVDARGQSRQVATQAGDGPDYIDLELGEGTLAGLDYELHWPVAAADAGPGGGDAGGPLFTWTVRGMPRVYVWSLRPSSGRVAPVGAMDLGFEIERLAGGTDGPLVAAGNPGGAAWKGLELLQQLDTDLRPAGQAVAIYAGFNQLLTQPQVQGGICLVSGPARAISPLVGEKDWSGFFPSAGTGADPGDEAALIALTAGGPLVLVRGADVGAKFLSPGALSPDGRTLVFVTHDFSDGTLVRLWGMALPEGWQTSGLHGDDLPYEIARALYAGQPGSHFEYGGSATWGHAGGRIWWDILLPETEVAEVWQVDPATGRRDLFAEGAAMPVESPDGEMVFHRTSSGGDILTIDGLLTRAVGQQFSWACWTPDSKAVLLVSDQGISKVPLQGPVQRLVSFAAGPGTFVGPDEFWFVSDRRF